MKEYSNKDIKNVVLLGSSKSGKTTLSEAMLYEGKVIDRRGTVEDKNTVSDNDELEKVNQRSIYATPLYAEFMGKKVNIIDAPGSDDFVGGAISAFRVCENGILVVNAQQGVEVGTSSWIRSADKHKIPLIVAVNQLDGEKADWETTIAALKEELGRKMIIVQFPIATGAGFNGFIDVLTNKYYNFKDANGTREDLDIPADFADQAEMTRQELIEKAAEFDDSLMEKFFEEGTLSEDDIRKGLSLGIRNCEVTPVFCVSAKKDIGVKRLLEFTKNVALSPDVDDTKPASLFIYKNMLEPHLGEVSYFKVMSGSVKPGDDLANADRGSKERIGQIYACAGANRIPVDQLCAGDIGCTVKLKDVKTGNTLNGKDVEQRFDFIKYPNSKYSRSIKAVNSSETEKLMAAMLKMRQEDPTWVVEQSKELRQTIVHGQGEFHLRTLKWRLENNEKIQVQFGEPKIPYRETITKMARADYRHKKQSGGAGQFGEVHLIVEPYAEGMPDPTTYKFNGQEFKMNIKGREEINLEWGGKLVFINSVVGGAIDARFMPAILKGIMERMESGPLTGSYARDVRVIVYDGKMHPVDSNELSFMLAARHAFAAAFKEAGPKILEPIYDLEVYVPSDFMGDVMSDLQGRRALIMGMDSEAGYQKLQAKIPLKELSNYSIALSSLTGGRASFTTKFASYELVPNDIQQQLIQAHEAEEEE